jgi:hypothetical protein
VKPRIVQLGDHVVYTQQHYLWLQTANRWPNKHAPRRDYAGDIIEIDDGNAEASIVRVKWRFGSASWHLADNVEVRS